MQVNVSIPSRLLAVIDRAASRTGAGRSGAAEEMGEIASDVRILKWMVGVVIALLLAGFTVVAAALFQISLRLPAS